MAAVVATEDIGVVAKRLELERVARGVEEEHGGLLSHLSRKSNVGLDHEFDPGPTETIGQCVPDRALEQTAEVGDGDSIAVDRVRGDHAVDSSTLVHHQLMAEEVEVDPMDVGPALAKTENLPVEAAGLDEIIDRQGQVETGPRFHARTVGRGGKGWG